MLKNAIKKDTKTEVTKSGKTYLPVVDITEDTDNIYVTADLPGVDKNDVNVTLEKDILTLEGKISNFTDDKEGKYHTEFHLGDFRRVFEIAENINQKNIQARVKNGVLYLTLTKEKPEKKKIEIELN